jgi:uncharacterized protein
MIAPDLIPLLCCPETRQELAVAPRQLIDHLNRSLELGQVKNRAGQVIRTKLDSGLVRADGECLYPIYQDLPVLLKDEAIPLSASAGEQNH